MGKKQVTRILERMWSVQENEMEKLQEFRI